MNILALKQSAIDFREKLEFYKDKEPAAMALYQQLEHLISAAENRLIREKIQARDIPGYRTFAESNLEQYPDLSRAYNNFFIELNEGRNSEAFKMLQKMLRKSRL
jgi:hypothetical protein